MSLMLKYLQLLVFLTDLNNRPMRAETAVGKHTALSDRLIRGRVFE